jgi:hypothetical protein
MFRPTLTAATIACLLICLTFARGATADSTPDLSTPKKAALAFAHAMERGDVAGAEAASIGSAEDDHLLQVIAGLVGAARQLRDAGVARFGDAGKSIVSCDTIANLSQQIATAGESITGNTAIVVHPREIDPMKLRRGDDGQWKVDLAAMSDKQSKMRVIPRVTKVLTTGAADLRAGKYHTAADANDAIGQQMFAIISEPTTRPARADATK